MTEQHLRAVGVRAAGELQRQPRLADAGLAGQHHQRPLTAARSLPLRVEHGQHRFATDEWEPLARLQRGRQRELRRAGRQAPGDFPRAVTLGELGEGEVAPRADEGVHQVRGPDCSALGRLEQLAGQRHRGAGVHAAFTVRLADVETHPERRGGRRTGLLQGDGAPERVDGAEEHRHQPALDLVGLMAAVVSDDVPNQRRRQLRVLRGTREQDSDDSPLCHFCQVTAGSPQQRRDLRH